MIYIYEGWGNFVKRVPSHLSLKVRMAHRGFLLLVVLPVIVLCSLSIQAQQKTSTGEHSQTTDAALREKAFNLLETLANQISSLQSAENRARLGSNIAGSLWPH